MLIACSVVRDKRAFDFLFGVIPRFEKCPQILPRAALKYTEHRGSSFDLLVDRGGVDRSLSASAALFSDYIVQIVAFFHIVASLAEPDTPAYNDQEVYLRIKKHHHAGLILRSTDAQRVPPLLEGYARRFVEEFTAVEPPREKPTA